MEAFARSKGVAVTLDLDPDMGEVVVDPDTLHRSLLNLINNAIDACLEDEDLSKSFGVKIQSKREGDDALLLSVSDNGCGMDEQTLAQLFTPMFSSKGGKGTGLGLLVTQKLIEEHQGRIHVETQPGQGTTFFVKLPFETAQAPGINGQRRTINE